jgi:hypothetical protein
MYHIFYSIVIFLTAGSGGALWVQRDSPDFRAHTHLWARTDLCLCRSSPLWHDSFICATWLIHMCDMTHSHLRHDSFVCVTWLIHMCDISRWSYWHDSFLRVTWLFHTRDMTRIWQKKLTIFLVFD